MRISRRPTVSWYPKFHGEKNSESHRTSIEHRRPEQQSGCSLDCRSIQLCFTRRLRYARGFSDDGPSRVHVQLQGHVALDPFLVQFQRIPKRDLLGP